MSRPRIEASTDSCGKEMSEMAINVTDNARTTVFSFDRNTPLSSLEGELTGQVWKEVIKYENVRTPTWKVANTGFF
jgi:hypothetical protein